MRVRSLLGGLSWRRLDERESDALYQSYGGMEGLPWTSSPPEQRTLPFVDRARQVYPGLLVAATIALASAWLSQHYGAPVMLFALLIGMTFHFLHQDGRCVPGINFASRTVLRLGVALLGARIGIAQIMALGWPPILLVVAGVATTIAAGLLLSAALGQSRGFGLLSGGAVAICGASAALALSAVLTKKVDERETVLAVIVVTTLSTIAMILYPMIATAVGLDHTNAGIFFGATIHDVAQVVGAGYTVSPETGDVAAYVKLLRVTMLLPVVMIIALASRRSAQEDGEARPPLLPLFLVAFVALIALNSIGLFTATMVEYSSEFSRWCLATAIAAIGMKSSFQSLVRSGWQPVMMMVGETVWLALLVLAVIAFL